MKQHSGRLPAGELVPSRAKGLSVWAGSGNATRVSPPARDGALQTGGSGHHERPAPGPVGAMRPPGAGRALAGDFGPPAGQGAAWRCGKGDGLCQSDRASARTPLRAGTGNANRVSPARSGRGAVDRQVREGQRPAPDPAGAKRPPRAGRALAGSFGPPAGQGSAWHCGRGDGPCHWSGGSAFVSVGGDGKRTAFPPPVRDGAL